jgi:Flp pilus assembly protein TadB
MSCRRCGATDDLAPNGWCRTCEQHYDTWSRQHAADIVWQTGSGAAVAMVIALGGLLVGASPVVAIAGVLAGATTFISLRRWGLRRRRRQYLETSVPRAMLRS